MVETQNYSESSKKEQVEFTNPDKVEFDETLNQLKKEEYKNMLTDIKNNPTSSLKVEKDKNGATVISFIDNGLPRQLKIGNDHNPTIYSERHSDGTVTHKLIRNEKEFYDAMEEIKKVYNNTEEERKQKTELKNMSDKLLKFKEGEGEFIQKLNEEYKDMLDDIREYPTEALKITKDKNGNDVIRFKSSDKDIRYENNLYMGDRTTRPLCERKGKSNDSLGRNLGTAIQPIMNEGDYRNVLEEIKKVYDNTEEERKQKAELKDMSNRLLKFKEGEGEFIQKLNEEYKDMLDDIREYPTEALKITKDKSGNDVIRFENSDKDIRYENNLYLGDGTTRPLCERKGKSNDSLGRNLGTAIQPIMNEGDYRKVLEEIKKVYNNTEEEREQTAALQKMGNKFISESYKPDFEI